MEEELKTSISGIKRPKRASANIALATLTNNSGKLSSSNNKELKKTTKTTMAGNEPQAATLNEHQQNLLSEMMCKSLAEVVKTLQTSQDESMEKMRNSQKELMDQMQANFEKSFRSIQDQMLQMQAQVDKLSLAQRTEQNVLPEIDDQEKKIVNQSIKLEQPAYKSSNILVNEDHVDISDRKQLFTKAQLRVSTVEFFDRHIVVLPSGNYTGKWLNKDKAPKFEDTVDWFNFYWISALADEVSPKDLARTILLRHMKESKAFLDNKDDHNFVDLLKKNGYILLLATLQEKEPILIWA